MSNYKVDQSEWQPRHDAALKQAADDLLDTNRTFSVKFEPGTSRRQRAATLICLARVAACHESWLLNLILKLAVRFL